MAEPTTSSPREGTSHQDPSLTIDEQQNGRPTNAIIPHPQRQQAGWLSRWRGALLTAGFAILITPFATVGHLVWPGERAIDPTNYALRTKRVLEKVPLIDGHNDLPWMIRVELHNRIYDGRFNPHQRLLGHTDISRLREGMVGGQFWSVYVHCDSAQKHFEDPSWIVRDTLEQIDITKRLVSEYSDVFTYCDTPACARAAHAKGRIASMIGIEGGHQLGGSLGALRQAYELGARYITTTHNCDNAWATAASTVAAGGVDHGLSTFGAHYVKESNRLGMMIDLSHVSHQTMRDVLSITEAPVIFSHSGAYSVTPHLRNVPDDVLRSVKKNGGIVMAVFVTRFLNMQNPDSVTIHDVVDHIWHLAEVAGWDHVGIGSDFSGTPSVPTGLEDVSKFPHLLQLVMERGATDEQIRGLAGDNLLRVWGDIQRRAKELQNGGSKPVEEEWECREWHHAYKSSPYMLRETRERAAKEDWGEPNQFNVKRGQNGPVVKEDKHL